MSEAFGVDHLKFKAMCALYEACELAHKGPVRPTFAIRFALAWLFSISNGDRAPFDDFWRQIQDVGLPSWADSGRNYARFTYSRTHLNGIARSIGWHFTVALDQALADATRRGAGAKVE